MSDHSDNESENEFESSWKKPAQILVAIDCHHSMFPNGFRTALSGTFKALDSIIFNKTDNQKIAVALYHTDPSRRSIIDFDATFSEGYLALKQALEENYTPCNYDSSYTFAEFLLECKKKLKGIKSKQVNKVLFFITNHEDPSDGDGTNKFRAMEEFRNMDYFKFELLILAEEFDYAPFYDEVGEILHKRWDHQYNEEFLTLKLLDTFQSNGSYKNLKFYFDVNVPSVSCRLRKYTQEAKLNKKKMTRDGNHEVVRRKVVPDGELKTTISIAGTTFEMDKTQIQCIKEVDDCPIGITLIHASKTRYSTEGLNLKVPHLLSAKNNNDDVYSALWDSCVERKLNLLCNIKYTKLGNIYNVELIPILLSKEKQFLVITMPSIVNYFGDNIQIEFERKPDVKAIAKLIEQASIEDYDIQKYRPFKYRQQMKYLKQEILGQNFHWDDSEYPDFVNEKLYTGNPEEAVAQLKELFPNKGVKRVAKKPAGKSTTSKKAK